MPAFGVLSSMEVLDNILDYVNRNKRILQLLLGIAIAIFIGLTELKAQSTEGFIYGKVFTRDTEYIGQLRWGNEEAYWHEHFNASKVSNEHSRALDRYRDRNKDKDSWRNMDWRISSIWEDKAKTVHQFGCQFGDIQQIKNYGGSRVVIMLKNGEEMELSGSGYNDIGTKVKVLDQELGEITIDWDRIDKIEFMPTPKNLSRTFGDPVYGTVKTYRNGDIEGYVVWDHDERLGTDKLDGDARDGDVSIHFDKIKSIRRDRDGSDVELLSGRRFYLTGSNDVNNSNRGIIVHVDGVGEVDIPWREFDAVEFKKPKSSGMAYSNYTTPRGLRGKVMKYRGGEVSGDIVFDLDESMEIEILEGKDNQIEYKIPFRNIKSIAPRNYNFSTVKMRNGKEILLGDGRDVSDNNAGLFVYEKGSSDPVYIEWRDVTEVIFD